MMNQLYLTSSSSVSNKPLLLMSINAFRDDEDIMKQP